MIEWRDGMAANLKQEIIDQEAHYVAGVALVVILNFLSGGMLWLAVLLTLTIAVGREILQRIERHDVWYGCAEGCRLDLIFWLLGILTGTLAVFYGQ